MDYQAITTFIGSIGFPIVAFLLIYKEMGETRKAHGEEITAITEALNRNTNVIEKLEMRLATKGGVYNEQ